MLDADCVDKGEYVDHGTFGEIYHGAVYPSVHATVCTVFIFVTVCVSTPLSLYCVYCVLSCINVSTPLFIVLFIPVSVC